ncbi:hypothetical protein [Enterococcus casseliflavus]|uniref:hypothetical protein n=1 Tax=Enterococcus casseliflavus TaxID=37734 RepID=UPI001E508798|nr:hypothetical protein [Enterococcus casseliflavus]MCD4961222.1 hypothetical protein [Enterococcus casseliflavus]
MIKLEEMGTILMHIALQYTHPDFESMYSDWSTVHDIGEKLVKMSDQPQLNENQQIVLEWLKKQYFQGYGPAIIRTIHLLQRENTIDVSGSEPVIEAYRSLDTAGEAMVVKLFADWALEQDQADEN